MNFTGIKYITSGVYNSIPFIVQQHIWDMIECQRKEKQILDYLLVVDFELLSTGIKITISQEEPIYKFFKHIDIEKNLELPRFQLFIIDSEEYITMMISDEY